MSSSLERIRSFGEIFSEITAPSAEAVEKIRSSLIPIVEIYSTLRIQTNYINEILADVQPVIRKISLISQELNQYFINSDMNSVLKSISSRLSNNILSSLSNADFRVNVVNQELQEVIKDNPKEVDEKLIFKDTSNPSDEIESQLFEILNNQRKILDNYTKNLNEINESEAENINNDKYEKIHKTPTSYRTKSWYTEQVESNFISLVITSIFAATIGVNPANTILFALLLRYLLNFIK